MAVIHDFIKNHPAGPALANELQLAAVKAIQSGLGGFDWKNYMCNFASNPEQLNRLVGDEDAFNATLYGKDSLAYLVANSTCGMTTETRTASFMNLEMLDGLDRNLLDDDLPVPDCEAAENPAGSIF
jgi:hypothetical protein